MSSTNCKIVAKNDIIASYMKDANVYLLTTALQDHGYSVTKPRLAVFAALSDDDAMSIGQLVKKLQPAIERTSVYRTVDLFEKLGIINRIHIGWKYKLELSEQFSHHHHHATCLTCGTSITFKENQQTEDSIHKIAEELGFQLQSHTLELRGLCKNCAVS